MQYFPKMCFRSNIKCVFYHQDAAEAVVGRGEVDRERVVVLGGSHGGFLTNHLLAQYPVSQADTGAYVASRLVHNMTLLELT